MPDADYRLVDGRSDTVEVSFQLTRAEFIKAVRFGYLRWSGLGWLLIAGLLAVVVAPFTSDVLVFLFIGVAWILLTLLACAFAPFFMWRRNPRARAMQSYVFAPDGVTARLLHAESRLDWSFYSGVVDVGDAYVLRCKRKPCNIVPKRSFTSPEDEERFSCLTSSRLSARFTAA